MVEVQCQCGNVKSVALNTLRTSQSKSCGCLKIEKAKQQAKELVKLHTTHGESRSKEYASWKAMQFRCYNPENSQFKNYGGRGLTVCDRWLGEQGLENFLADMGKAPTESHSLERKNNEEGYNPENCKWSTKKEQARNRRSNRRIEYLGENLTLAEWVEKTGINQSTMYNRLFREKWPTGQALGLEPRTKVDV
jgi:hypothetical protein